MAVTPEAIETATVMTYPISRPAAAIRPGRRPSSSLPTI